MSVPAPCHHVLNHRVSTSPVTSCPRPPCQYQPRVIVCSGRPSDLGVFFFFFPGLTLTQIPSISHWLSGGWSSFLSAVKCTPNDKISFLPVPGALLPPPPPQHGYTHWSWSDPPPPTHTHIIFSFKSLLQFVPNMSARRHPRTLSPTWSSWLSGGAWCTVGPLGSQRSSGDWGDLVRLTGMLTKHPRPNQLRMQFGRRVKILKYWGVSICIVEPFIRGLLLIMLSGVGAPCRWSQLGIRESANIVCFSVFSPLFFFFSFWEVSYDFPYIE